MILTVFMALMTLNGSYIRDFILQPTAGSFYGSGCSFGKNDKAVMWVLDPGSGSGPGYVRETSSESHNPVWCPRLCVRTRARVFHQFSRLIPWESAVRPGHVGSSQGKSVAGVSHQADDRGLRALHAAPVSAMIASLGPAISLLHLLIGW